jgi:hypothetical protein
VRLEKTLNELIFASHRPRMKIRLYGEANTHTHTHTLWYQEEEATLHASEEHTAHARTMRQREDVSIGAFLGRHREARPGAPLTACARHTAFAYAAHSAAATSN